MKTLFKIIMIMLLIGGVLYLGTCAYANFFAGDTTQGAVKMPAATEAAYSLIVKNTGTLLLFNEYEVFGSQVGERNYILQGYWELIGNEFKYRNQTINISEAIFGEVTLRRRQ